MPVCVLSLAPAGLLLLVGHSVLRLGHRGSRAGLLPAHHRVPLHHLWLPGQRLQEQVADQHGRQGDA